MTWLALRLLRPYLIVAGSVAAAATAYVLHAAGVVQRQLDRAGVPDCRDPNECYPSGGALNAVLGMELVAAFVPPLLGLILGVALFAREREEDTIAFVLTQSVPRERWVLTKLGWALAAGAACAACVATAHRLAGIRYTVLANDTYELLQLLHFNNAGYMVGQTVVLIALAAVLGLVTGRTLPTLVLTVIGGPFVVMAGGGVAVLLFYPLGVLTGGTDPAADGTAGTFADDMTAMDPFAYLAGAVLGAGAVALALLARRAGSRASR